MKYQITAHYYVNNDEEKIYMSKYVNAANVDEADKTARVFFAEKYEPLNIYIDEIKEVDE